jgi:hypothetical protein
VSGSCNHCPPLLWVHDLIGTGRIELYPDMLLNILLESDSGDFALPLNLQLAIPAIVVATIKLPLKSGY